MCPFKTSSFHLIIIGRFTVLARFYWAEIVQLSCGSTEGAVCEEMDVKQLENDNSSWDEGKARQEVDRLEVRGTQGCGA